MKTEKRKTNLDYLMNAVKKAGEENIKVYVHASPAATGYIVVNGNNAYVVGVEAGKVTHCSCPHHYHRGVVCKHMVKVSQENGLDIAMLSEAE